MTMAGRPTGWEQPLHCSWCLPDRTWTHTDCKAADTRDVVGWVSWFGRGRRELVVWAVASWQEQR